MHRWRRRRRAHSASALHRELLIVPGDRLRCSVPRVRSGCGWTIGQRADQRIGQRRPRPNSRRTRSPADPMPRRGFVRMSLVWASAVERRSIEPRRASSRSPVARPHTPISSRDKAAVGQSPLGRERVALLGQLPAPIDVAALPRSERRVANASAVAGWSMARPSMAASSAQPSTSGRMRKNE